MPGPGIARFRQDQWLYRSDRTTYFYATGFNMVRLLDTLNIKYKTRLFNEGGLSLEKLLKGHRAKKSKHPKTRPDENGR